MPKEGYKAVTLKEAIYKQVNEIAQKEDRSIASIVTEAIRQFMETHKGEGS